MVQYTREEIKLFQQLKAKATKTTNDHRIMHKIRKYRDKTRKNEFITATNFSLAFSFKMKQNKLTLS